MYVELLRQVFSPIISWITYIIIILAGTMLNGIIVVIGDGWGTIRGSKTVQSKNRLIFFFATETVIIAFLLDLFKPQLEEFLLKHIQFLPPFLLNFFVLFYVWFNHAFDFEQDWKLVGILQVPFFFLLYLAFFGA